MNLRKANHGFTLIELLIGFAIGLLVVGAMIALYVNQSRTYRQLEAVSRMQENARHAFEIMGYDLRMAGNWGCYNPSKTLPTNFLNNSTANWWTNSSRPVFGHSEKSDSNAIGDADFPPEFSTNALRGDSILILRADHDPTSAISGTYDLGTGNIPVSSGSVALGDLLVLTDCQSQTAIFQKTGSSTSAVEHAGVATPTPGNCQAHLAGSACGSSFVATSVIGAKIMPLLAHAYYLRNSPRKYGNGTNIPSLYRQVLAKSSGNATTAAEELLDGVADMQIFYGEDTSSTPDGSVDSYRLAKNVTNWANVISVRVTLTLESSEDNLATSSLTFTYGNGSTVTDRRLRRQFSATFGIRSRLS